MTLRGLRNLSKNPYVLKACRTAFESCPKELRKAIKKVAFINSNFNCIFSSPLEAPYNIYIHSKKEKEGEGEGGGGATIDSTARTATGPGDDAATGPDHAMAGYRALFDAYPRRPRGSFEAFLAACRETGLSPEALRPGFAAVIRQASSAAFLPYAEKAVMLAASCAEPARPARTAEDAAVAENVKRELERLSKLMPGEK